MVRKKFCHDNFGSFSLKKGYQIEKKMVISWLFWKKTLKNPNLAELPRFESPDVANENFPAGNLYYTLVLFYIIKI